MAWRFLDIRRRGVRIGRPAGRLTGGAGTEEQEPEEEERKFAWGLRPSVEAAGAVCQRRSQAEVPLPDTQSQRRERGRTACPVS